MILDMKFKHCNITLPSKVGQRLEQSFQFASLPLVVQGKVQLEHSSHKVKVDVKATS